MASSAFPAVVAGAVTAFTTALSPTRVVRGRDYSNSVGDVVMVGVASLDDSPGWDSAGSFDQQFQTFGGARSETGIVNGVAYSSNGDADQAAATTAAFALIEGIGSAVRADRTLGVTGFDYIVAEFQAGNVKEQQNSDGAVTEIAFAIQYQARI